jgi:hypothetical protein
VNDDDEYTRININALSGIRTRYHSVQTIKAFASDCMATGNGLKWWSDNIYGGARFQFHSTRTIIINVDFARYLRHITPDSWIASWGIFSGRKLKPALCVVVTSCYPKYRAMECECSRLLRATATQRLYFFSSFFYCNSRSLKRCWLLFVRMFLHICAFCIRALQYDRTLESISNRYQYPAIIRHICPFI